MSIDQATLAVFLGANTSSRPQIGSRTAVPSTVNGILGTFYGAGIEEPEPEQFFLGSVLLLLAGCPIVEPLTDAINEGLEGAEPESDPSGEAPERQKCSPCLDGDDHGTFPNGAHCNC